MTTSAAASLYRSQLALAMLVALILTSLASIARDAAHERRLAAGIETMSGWEVTWLGVTLVGGVATIALVTALTLARRRR